MKVAIMQAVIKAVKAAIMAKREADNSVNNARPVHAVPQPGCKHLKQHPFHCKVADNIKNCAT